MEGRRSSRRRQSAPDPSISKTPTIQRRVSLPEGIAVRSNSMPATPRLTRRFSGEENEATRRFSGEENESGVFDSFREDSAEWARVLTESGVEFSYATNPSFNSSSRSPRALSRACRASREADSDAAEYSTDNDGTSFRDVCSHGSLKKIEARIHESVSKYQERAVNLLAAHLDAQVTGEGLAWTHILASVADNFESTERAMRQVALEIHDANVDEAREKFRQQEKMYEKKMEVVRKAAETKLAQERLRINPRARRMSRSSGESIDEDSEPTDHGAPLSDSPLPEENTPDEKIDDSHQLRDRLRTAEMKLEELGSERDHLQVQLAAAASEAKRASEEQAEECKRLTQKLAKRLEQEMKKTRHQSVGEQLDALDSQVVQLRREKRELRADFTTMRSEVLTLEEDMDAVNNELEVCKVAIQEAMRTLGMQMSDNQSFKVRVRALVAKMNAMAGEMEAAKAAVAMATSPGATTEEPARQVVGALANTDRTVTDLLNRLQTSEQLRTRALSDSERARESLVRHLLFSTSFSTSSHVHLSLPLSSSPPLPLLQVRATLVALQSLRAHLTRTLSGLTVQQAQQTLQSEGAQRVGPLALPEVTVRSPPFQMPSRPQSVQAARQAVPSGLYSSPPRLPLRQREGRRVDQAFGPALHRLISNSVSPELQKRRW